MFFKVNQVVTLAFCLAFASPLSAGEKEKQAYLDVSGPYFGQPTPGDTPVMFAPCIVSTDTAEWSMAFTPGGLEVFFGLAEEGAAFILHSIADERGAWTEPVIATFSGEFNDFDLTMSPDGNRLYFTSNRPPVEGGATLEHPDIWYVDRTDKGWGEPVHIDAPINTDMRELYPSESRDGFIYFFGSRPEGFGGSDLYRAPYRDGQFGEPENLGPSVNTEAGEGDASISPDGDYLIFTSTRETGFGSGDLYVTFKLDDDRWSPPANLGEAVNTEYLEFCPAISRDGKYLFFTSNRPKDIQITKTTAVREKLGLKPGGEHPDTDIYWVDAALIEQFRPLPEE